MAEQLESRVLYSGAPIDASFDYPVHEVKQMFLSNFEGITGFQVEARPQFSTGTSPEQSSVQSSGEAGLMITLTSLDNLSSEEVAMLVSQQWVDSEVVVDTVASKPIDYQILEVDVDYIGEFHGYEILIDTERNENSFVDVRLGKSHCWFAVCDTQGNATYGLDRSGGNLELPVSYGLDLIAESLENLTTHGAFEVTKTVLWCNP